MRVRRTAVAGVVAGGLALSLVAAETPAATSVGSASTRLLGAQVRVTGPIETPVARLLDVTTGATTDGTPFAATSVVPIAVGDEHVGATGASSDGDTSSTSDGGSYGSALELLGLDVQPVETTATASADRALATVGAATGQLSALLGQLGLELDTTGVTSLVTTEEASATQGLQVSGLAVSLADLGLDADLLGQLGLDDVLALLAQLPVDVPEDLADVTGLLGDIEDLEAALASLETVAAPVVDLVGDLDLLAAALPEVGTLDALRDGLLALDGASATNLLAGLTARSDDLAAVGCPVDGLPASLLGLLDPLGTLQGLLDDAVACVEGELSAIGAGLTANGIDGIPSAPGDLLGALEDLQATLTGLVPDELAGIVTQLETITDLLAQILASLADLDDLLALLPDLLGDAAGLDLLDIGAFDVGTTAVAAGSVEDSSATLLCNAVDITVLGEAFATPDCSEALSGLAPVSDLVNGAVGELAGVLNSLPLGDLVQVGDLRARVFTDVVEEVTEVDGVITSTAGFNLLDLAIPSITIDASQVTDPLGGLGLPDVLGPVQGLLDDLGGLDGLSATVDDLLGTLSSDAAALTGTVDQATTLLDGLDLADLGSLDESISTPGVELLIDPVSTASFSATAGDGIADPGPDQEPEPAPSLPSTGGGLALLGVLALAGAGSLRRRR